MRAWQHLTLAEVSALGYKASRSKELAITPPSDAGENLTDARWHLLCGRR